MGDPAWLVAWRARQAAPAAPAQRPVQPPKPTVQGVAPGKREVGIVEPLPWGWDGGKRRAKVFDHDHTPPRYIRQVGWNRCLRCKSPFWSEDVIGIRLCHDCKAPPMGLRGRNGRKRIL